MARTTIGIPEPQPEPRRVPRGRRRRAQQREFAFCEAVTAGPLSPWHIREVGPEGRKPGGGVPNVALCGFDVRRGWDIQTAVTAEYAARLATPQPGDRSAGLCPRCHRCWVAATGG